MSFTTYRSYSTMDEIKSINSISDAEQFFERRGATRAEAFCLVQKMQRAVINDSIKTMMNILTKPDVFY